LSFARRRLDDGERVIVQLSAHGAALPATLRAHDVAATLTLDEPSRPYAPGQLAVLYDPADPDLVVGAATVARHALVVT
jgi:tRNA U34 2-thiouridine synthase MnmA/TrmU